MIVLTLCSEALSDMAMNNSAAGISLKENKCGEFSMPIKRIIAIVIISIVFVACNAMVDEFDRNEIEFIDNAKTVLPSAGIIKDEKIALAIAEIIWISIYGDNIKRMKPFVAKLVDDTYWYVKGTLQNGMVGGVPYLVIKKDTGEVIKIFHTK